MHPAPHLHVYVSLLGANSYGPPSPHSNATNADELWVEVHGYYQKGTNQSWELCSLPP